MSHHCHAQGADNSLRSCPKETAPRFAMCAHHWGMCPKEHQDAIWAHYRPGQERDKKPTARYLLALFEAIAEVARPEGFAVPTMRLNTIKALRTRVESEAP